MPEPKQKRWRLFHRTKDGPTAPKVVTAPTEKEAVRAYCEVEGLDDPGPARVGCVLLGDAETEGAAEGVPGGPQ